MHILLSYRSATLCIVLGPEETTCTTRTKELYVGGEIMDSALI